MTGTDWRYNPPMMRSWVVGEPNDRQRGLAEAAIAVFETVIAEARPGRTGHDVATIAAKQWDAVPGVHIHGGYATASAWPFSRAGASRRSTSPQAPSASCDPA